MVASRSLSRFCLIINLTYMSLWFSGSEFFFLFIFFILKVVSILFFMGLLWGININKLQWKIYILLSILGFNGYQYITNLWLLCSYPLLSQQLFWDPNKVQSVSKLQLNVILKYKSLLFSIMHFICWRNWNICLVELFPHGVKVLFCLLYFL